MTSPKGTAFLEEFKSFVGFLKNLWGILGSLSVLFPLSNALANVIPLGTREEGTGLLEFVAPPLVNILATVMSLFVVLWTYGKRQKARTERKSFQRQAWLSFGCALLALGLYLWMNSPAMEDIYWGILGAGSGHPLRFMGDVLLLLSYSAFFASMTRAFVLLGMIEFFGREH